MTEPTLVQTENQSSFEFGPAKRRFKIYFWTAQELGTKIVELAKTVQEQEAFMKLLEGAEK
jgi:hypothetical protein